MRALTETIKKELESGMMLSEALGKHPAYFNRMVCSLVDSGEKSGSLDIMLERIASWKENIETLKKKIRKAMIYPLTLLVMALLVTTMMLVFVIPQFESLLKESGAELPVLTRMVIRLSHFFQSCRYVMAGALAGVFWFIHAKKQSVHCQHQRDRIILKIPIVANIIKKAIIVRFSRTLSILFAAGLPLTESLKTAAETSGNIVYKEAVDSIGEGISAGQQLHEAMANTRLFPQLVTQMISVGEESGTLERMLGKVADFYEEEVDNAIDAFTSLLEPVIISILGVLVGGLVIAMYLPIFNRGFAL